MTRSPTVERGGMRDGEIEVDDSAKENGSRESRSDTDKEREGEKDSQSRTHQGDEDDTVEY